MIYICITSFILEKLFYILASLLNCSRHKVCISSFLIKVNNKLNKEREKERKENLL